MVVVVGETAYMEKKTHSIIICIHYMHTLLLHPSTSAKNAYTQVFFISIIVGLRTSGCGMKHRKKP